MSSSKPMYVVNRDHIGPYVASGTGWFMFRTMTERGAIREAKRLNREYELKQKPSVRVWPKEDES